MMTACWVCGATDTELHERVGGMRCVDAGPCEARQPAYLARLRTASAQQTSQSFQKVPNTMKVVISKRFGGFGLSRAAFLRLRELGCAAAKSEPDIGENYDDGSGPRKSFAGMDSFCSEVPRNDPHLVQVVEEMGAKANSDFSKLVVVEIPDGIEWEVDEYDGYEKIVEKHRSWS